MSVRNPKTQRQAERSVVKKQGRFRGMLSGIPSSDMPAGYSAKNSNLIDMGGWTEGRPGTRPYTTTALPTGQLRARCEHNRADVLVMQYGTTLYVVNKAMTVFTEVVNISGVTPADSSGTLVPRGEDAVLANDNGAFLVVLDDPNGYYYMLRLNIPLPEHLVNDQAETASESYGYRYIYALALLDGTGVRTRQSDNAEIVLESATCRVDGQNKDYGECFYETPVGEDLTTDHVVGPFIVPKDVYEITHIPLYRTKNIGIASGGVNPTVEGVGNRYDLMVWVDDIPVAQAFTARLAGNTLTASIGVFTRNMVGCALYDAQGGNNDTIVTYLNSHQVTITGAGTIPGGDQELAIGHGRVMRASQTGTTITRLAGDQFVASDVGKRKFWADGGESVIVSVDTVAQTAQAAWGAAHASQASTLAPTLGTFWRLYNDTTLDDSGGTARDSLQARVDADSTYYIPRRFMRPIDNCNMVGIGGGFAVWMNRDSATYQFTQTGDKPYAIGYYRPVDQEGELEDGVRLIISAPSLMVLMAVRRTYGLQLTATLDTGRTEVGENVYSLQPPVTLDENVGVWFWQSVVPVGAGRFIAVTSEPGVRMWQDGRWGDVDYALDEKTGLDAIKKEYLQRVDPFYGCVATYTEEDGYEVWFYRWEEDESDDVLLDTGGTAITGDDVINDTGGTALGGNNVWHDTGGDMGN